jgi:hypothetical protein
LIEEAAKNGADIVAFPEAFVPGYPLWIWWALCSVNAIAHLVANLNYYRSRSMDFDMGINYTQNSLVVGSEEMKQIQSCAPENDIVVCLG